MKDLAKRYSFFADQINYKVKNLYIVILKGVFTSQCKAQTRMRILN